MKKFTFILGLVFFGIIRAFGQPYFPEPGQAYRTDVMPRVDITINEDSLQWIYDHVDSDHEFKAHFVYAAGGITDTVSEVGFRLRGNTSRQSQKKSFKVSFNTFTPGGKFYGIEKMNLNGEHNDPSIIRSHLVWNFFNQMRLPGSRSNHVDLYINGRFYGLYINVEHVDEEFVESRFGNNGGNLYKCLYPANLNYLGSNPNDYKNGGYELKTNEEQDDYSDLIDFIHTLSNATAAQLPQNVEPIFNINGFLRYLAVEIFTGHWDAYSFGQNNYYLYHNQFTGKFEFIPYDVDNTFGIDWFGIDWATRDIYQWWNSGEALTGKVFGNQVYVDRFSFFLNELLTNYANTDTYFPEIDAIKAKIDASAEADAYRTYDYNWSFADYNNSYTEALSTFHVKYGLKPYITARINSIGEQLVLNPIAPIVENVYHNFPQINQTIVIQANVTDDEANPSAELFYQVNDGAFLSVSMPVNGQGKFVANIPALSQAAIVNYYIEASDASGNTTREPSFGTYQINLGISTASLVISEFMASNTNTIVDNYGASEDWIEIHNTGTESINLKGKYLSDDLSEPTKFKLPDVTLEPNAYYVFWADDDSQQGANHTNFKLSASGESIGLFDSFEANFAPIDTLNYSAQSENISLGLSAAGNWEPQQFITPGGENNSNQVAFVTFKFNMNKQIAEGNFDPETDYLDVAGTFNGWSSNTKVFDGNDDGIYAYSTFGFVPGETIEYKARINGDWGTAEFPDLGGDGNRAYTIAPGHNVIEHWYNDQETNLSEAPFKATRLYPNPSQNGNFSILQAQDITRISIYRMNGILWKQFSGIGADKIDINANLPQGMYMVQVESNQHKTVLKLMVY